MNYLKSLIFSVSPRQIGDKVYKRVKHTILKHTMQALTNCNSCGIHWRDMRNKMLDKGNLLLKPGHRLAQMHLNSSEATLSTDNSFQREKRSMP